MSGASFKNLLVIRLGALGDCMHVLPSIQTVQAFYPETTIHWLTLPAFHPLLERQNATCWAYQKPKGVVKQVPWLLGLANQLKAATIDGVVNLHPSLKTMALTQLLGVPSAVYRKQKLPVTGVAERTTPRRHAIEDFYQPFRHLLPALPEWPLAPPTLHGLSPVDLEARYGTGTHGAVILGVGGKRPNRAWPLSHWHEWTQQLATQWPTDRTPLHLHLIGGPDETELAQAFLAQLPPEVNQQLTIHNQVGQTTVVGMAELLAGCRWAIGGDTGPLHVAAAAGTAKVIGLFAPTSVARTGPRGTGTMHTLTPSVALACWPCEQPTCASAAANHPPCIGQITVEIAVQAVIVS